MDLENKIEDTLTDDVVCKLGALLKNREYKLVIQLIAGMGCNMSDLFIKLWSIREDDHLIYPMDCTLRGVGFPFILSREEHSSRRWLIWIPLFTFSKMPELRYFNAESKTEAFDFFGKGFVDFFKQQ